jgi:hypothetical protein
MQWRDQVDSTSQVLRKLFSYWLFSAGTYNHYMPYIKPDRRAVFEKAINAIVSELGSSNPASTDEAAKGELNYCIFSIVDRYLKMGPSRYSRFQDFIGGTLSACQHELFRRIIDPYEDAAIKRNGDVLIPPYPSLGSIGDKEEETKQQKIWEEKYGAVKTQW